MAPPEETLVKVTQQRGKHQVVLCDREGKPAVILGEHIWRVSAIHRALAFVEGQGLPPNMQDRIRVALKKVPLTEDQ